MLTRKGVRIIYYSVFVLTLNVMYDVDGWETGRYTKFNFNLWKKKLYSKFYEFNNKHANLSQLTSNNYPDGKLMVEQPGKTINSVRKYKTK